MATCKGCKKDGTPCESPIVLDNGYCRAHQDQAPEAKATEEPVRWTRERLEEAIAAHGGPEGLDLADADLSNLDLSEMDLHGIVLSRWDEESQTWIGAKLQNASMEDAKLQGADLRYTNLQGAYLQRADLWGAKLQGARLWDADLQGAILWGANLQRANLYRAKLQGADLSVAKLQRAILYDAELQRASLEEAKLQEANLGVANLQEANLGSANLQGAILYGANLQSASLRYTNLQEANLRDADLKRANLRSADLREVDLLDVISLQGIKLYRAKLDHTLLKREQLGSAIGEEQAGEYRQARDAYLALKQNFDNLGDYAASAWAYQKERNMEKATKAPWRCRKYYGEEEPFPCSMQGLIGKLWPNLRQYGRLPRWSPLVWWFWLKYTGNWLVDWFVEVLCGYGESIKLVLFWMVAALFGFAAYYRYIGGVWLVESYGPMFTATSFWHYLIYSAGAFTTTGFARFQAANDWVRMVTAIQAIVGIILAGLLGFVVGNRIRRS
jgi:uncharacterized protein YjbI with pentapeptide repeats